jgi:beta-lactam-binding protein with PASTA domain
MEVHMSKMRTALLPLLVVASSGCSGAVATLSGVGVGGRLATAAEIGRVSVVHSNQLEPTRLGMPLSKGDTITTSAGTTAMLVFQEEWEVAMDSGTALYVSNPKAWIKRGRIFVKQLVDRVREAFEVEDEHSVFGAQGTEFVIESDGGGGVSISVVEGSVRVSPKEAEWEPIVYGPLERGHLQADAPPQRMPDLTEAEADEIRTFTAQLERLSRVSVPPLVGLPRLQAQTTLRESGLTPGDRVRTRMTGQFEQDYVIEQSPVAGTVVWAGTEVELVVEAPSVLVPTVVGLQQEAATSQLAEMGLRVTRVRTVQSAQYPPGTVVDQSRAAQSRVEPGTTIELTVAIEPRVSVPALRGMNVANARETLASLGLVLGSVATQTTLEVPAGTVVGQNPSQGTQVAPRSTVTLTVAQPPPFCVVPNLVERSVSQARELLREAGLTEGQITAVGAYQQNMVSGQAIEPGQRVPCGTPVSFQTGVIG